MDYHLKSVCLYTNVTFSSSHKKNNNINVTISLQISQMFQFCRYFGLSFCSLVIIFPFCPSPVRCEFFPVTQFFFSVAKAIELPHQESLILPHCHRVCWSPSSNCSSKGLCLSVAHSSLLSQPAQGLCDKTFCHSNYTAIYSMTGNQVSQ